MTRLACLTAVAAVLAARLSVPTSAHVTFISPYTFNEHVRPILRERCGACHGPNGPGRPLLDYTQAVRGGVEIARSVMAGRMPPWSAEAGAAAFKGQQRLTLRELDTVMAWATGGVPEGPAQQSPPLLPPQPDLRASALGVPDLALTMPGLFVLEPGQSTAVHEEVFDGTAARGRAIRAVDVTAGDSSIVRRAEVAIRTRSGDRPIGLWVPGDVPQALEADAAYAVPRDASVVLRVHYLRPWNQPPVAKADRSRVSLFFSKLRNPPDPRDLVVAGEGVFPVDQSRTVSVAVERTVRALALRPISGPVDAIVALDILGADGGRQPLARLQLRADWPRRYLFTAPVTLPAGSSIEARVSRRDPVVWATLTGDSGIPKLDNSLRIALEVLD